MYKKIMCIGDLHVKGNNLEEFGIFEKLLYELVTTEKPEMIVILGDTLDKHAVVDTFCLNTVVQFLDNLRKQVSKIVILVGNHDATKNTEFLTTNHWLNCLKFMENIIVVDTVHRLSFDSSQSPSSLKDILFVPYVPPGMFKIALDTISSTFDWKKADLIIAHQEFKGCKMGPIISIDGDEWSTDFPQVISGHIHSNQTVGTNIYYPGSALQNAFGESEKNVIPMIWWEENNKNYTKKEVDLGLPRKKIVSVALENIDNIEIKQGQGKLTRLTVKGTYEEFKVFKNTTKYKELSSKGVTIAFRKQDAVETKEEKEGVEGDEFKKEEEKSDNSLETSFDDLLFELVTKENNEKLLLLYHKIVKNN